jgi:hypothetical protein
MSGSLKVGLLLSSADTFPWEEFEQSSLFLLEQGHHPYAYFLHTGVLQLTRPALRGLLQRGLRLNVCSLAAEKHGLTTPEEAILCGLGTLASIIQHTDSFFSFSSDSYAIRQPAPHHLIAVSIENPPDDPEGSTLESLRVATGLAQLSELKVQIQFAGKALALFSPDFKKHDLALESMHYLELIHEAGGTLILPEGTTDCPIPYQVNSPDSQSPLLLKIG